MIGRTIGNYRVVEKLGEGGMGAVYRAIDQMVDRNVAIKVLKPEVASNPNIYDRFVAEAKALAKLNHPAIAMLYSMFREGDEYFMVMEYVAGQNLEKFIRAHGAIRWPQAAGTMLRALEGVGHAHAQGIIHRDLKPANLMLTYEGGVKVTDFGIARVFFEPRLTRESRVVGTTEYMAPERVLGKDGDARSDIYSLGVILYEMLTGRLPFQGTSEYELIRAQVEQAPPCLAELGVTVPAPIEQALMLSLAKDPAQRHPDAAAFSAQLRSGLMETTAERLTPPPKETVVAPVAKETILAPVAKETVLAPVAKETVLAPVAKETVLAPAAKETVLAPVAKETVLAPVARPTVLAPPSPPTAPQPPTGSAQLRPMPRGLQVALAGAALFFLLSIAVAGYIWRRASRERAEPPQAASSTSPAVAAPAPNNSTPTPPVAPAPITPAPEPVTPVPTPPPAPDKGARPAPPQPTTRSPIDNKQTTVAPPPEPAPIAPAPNPTTGPPPSPAPPKPDDKAVTKPSARSLFDVHNIYLTRMPEDLDGHIRQEFDGEFKGRVHLVDSAASADAVMNVAIEDEHGNRVVGATGRLVGLKGTKRVVATLVAGDRQLWTGTVDDRHSIITSSRDDMKRLASRIVKRLHADLR